MATKKNNFEESNTKSCPEIEKLYSGVQKGIDYICKKFDELDSEDCDTDPNDVVRWVKDASAMAESFLSFSRIISGSEESKDRVRGGDAIGSFENPNR